MLVKGAAVGKGMKKSVYRIMIVTIEQIHFKPLRFKYLKFLSEFSDILIFFSTSAVQIYKIIRQLKLVSPTQTRFRDLIFRRMWTAKIYVLDMFTADIGNSASASAAELSKYTDSTNTYIRANKRAGIMLSGAS